jgi:hypothetical protein
MADVLFFLSYFDDSHIPAWTMELMEDHRQKGDVLWIVKCGQGLDACHGAKLGRDPQTCVRCVSRTHYVLRRLGLSPDHVEEIPRYRDIDVMRIPFFRDVDELKQYQFEGVTIGLGAASTLISGLHDHGFVPEEQRAPIEANLRSAMRVVRFFRQFLVRHRPDLVYAFNGRFAESRPVIDVCVENGIRYRTYEIGGSARRYQLFDNQLPHEMSCYRDRIEAAWAACDDQASREKVAVGWFENRRRRIDQKDNQPVFAANQERSALPPGFDSRTRNIVIFNSAEEEFAAIGDGASFAAYAEQNEALHVLVERLARRSDVHVYLRVHPSLSRLDNAQNRALRTISAPNFTLIPGESPVDSYSLLDASDCAVSFGSTIGVEATFWGKPSLLFGRALYEGLGAVYEPQTFDEVLELVGRDALAPCARVAAMKYGYWAARAGEEVQRFADMLDPDRYTGYDRSGVMYQKVMAGLLHLSYPVTYTPFYRQILNAVAARSRRDFYRQRP